MWDSGTNCQNVGQMWDKSAKCGKCGNVGRLYSLSMIQFLKAAVLFYLMFWSSHSVSVLCDGEMLISVFGFSSIRNKINIVP